MVLDERMCLEIAPVADYLVAELTLVESCER